MKRGRAMLRQTDFSHFNESKLKRITTIYTKKVQFSTLQWRIRRDFGALRVILTFLMHLSMVKND